MYRCLSCGEGFHTPKRIAMTYESYYGVSSEFSCHTPMVIETCPHCESEDIDEVDEVYEEEE